MNDKITKEAVDIILKSVVTAVLYMVEHNGRVDFIYVSQSTVSDEILYPVQEELKNLFDCDVELVDINYFDILDRLQVIKKAEMVYCEGEKTKDGLQWQMAKEIQDYMHKRVELIKRRKEDGVFYMQ